jgi:hypothetical protein
MVIADMIAGMHLPQHAQKNTIGRQPKVLCPNPACKKPLPGPASTFCKQCNTDIKLLRMDKKAEEAAKNRGHLEPIDAWHKMENKCIECTARSGEVNTLLLVFNQSTMKLTAQGACCQTGLCMRTLSVV